MKTFFTLGALAIGTSLMAQITINSSDFVGVGDQAILDVDTVLIGFSVGSAGANQTYDFSNAVGHELDTFTFVTPASTPYASSYPNSNLAFSAGPGFNYMNKTSSKIEILGAVFPNPFGVGAPLEIHILPAEKVGEFPMNYNNTWTDNSVSDFSLFFGQNGLDSLRLKSVKAKSVTIDGWGTVTTAYGTYDCLRQFSTTINTDSTWGYVPIPGFWTLLDDDIYVDSTFDWMSNHADTKWPVVTADVDGNGNIIDLSVLQTTGLPVSLVESELSNVQLYPNPTNSQVWIDGLEANKSYKLSVTSLTGSLVQTKNFVGSKQNSFDLIDLSKGAYLIQIEDNEGEILMNQKLMIK